jgi:HEAT repeat protein
VKRLHVPTRRENHHPVADIPELIAELGSQDGVERERARETLVALGKAAVAPLVSALSDQDGQVRWEAANALSCLRDPSAASALVEALGDDRSGVRWLAAEALIALGQGALALLLKPLSNPANAALIGDGARHVLHVLARNKGGQWLTPVVEALNSYEPGVAVPLAALRDLGQLRAKATAGVPRRPASDNTISQRVWQ